MPEPIDAYHQWLGIPPSEQPPNAYRLLGVRLFEADLGVIRTAADRQMIHLRTYQLGEYSDLSQRLLNEVASARAQLLDPKRKAEYDRRLSGQLQAATPAAGRAAGRSPGGVALGERSRPPGSSTPKPPPRLLTGATAAATAGPGGMAQDRRGGGRALAGRSGGLVADVGRGIARRDALAAV